MPLSHSSSSSAPVTPSSSSPSAGPSVAPAPDASSSSFSRSQPRRFAALHNPSPASAPQSPASSQRMTGAGSTAGAGAAQALGPATSTTASIAFTAAVAAGDAKAKAPTTAAAAAGQRSQQQQHARNNGSAQQQLQLHRENQQQLLLAPAHLHAVKHVGAAAPPSSSAAFHSSSATSAAAPVSASDGRSAPPSSSVSASSSASPSSVSAALSLLRGGSYLTRHEWRADAAAAGDEREGDGAVASSPVFVWLSGEGRSARLSWCAAHAAAGGAVAAADGSVLVRSITDLMVRKKTAVLSAAGVSDDCAFALLSNAGVSLHLQAADAATASAWKEGLVASLRDTGKHIRRVADGRSSSAAASGGAAAQQRPRAPAALPPTPASFAEGAAPATLVAIELPARAEHSLGGASTSSPSSLLSSSASPSVPPSSSSSSSSSSSPSSEWWLLLLSAGAVFRMYGKNSRRVVECNRMRVSYRQPEGGEGGLGHLYWTSPSDTTLLPQQSLWLGSVHAVTWRKDSGLLRSGFASAARSDLCFSILAAQRHLHLEASSFHTVKQWMHALHLAFTQHHLQVDMPLVAAPAAAAAAEAGTSPPSASSLMQPQPASASSSTPQRAADVSAPHSPEPYSPSTPSSPLASSTAAAALPAWSPTPSIAPSTAMAPFSTPSTPSTHASCAASLSPWSAPSSSASSPPSVLHSSPLSSPSVPFSLSSFSTPMPASAVPSVLLLGAVFRMFDVSSASTASAAEVFLFLVPDAPAPARAAAAGSAAASVACLYWCPPVLRERRKRLPDQRLYLQDIERVTLGKSSAILSHSIATAAAPSRCLSIVSPSLTLHLEAADAQARDDWHSALTRLVPHSSRTPQPHVAPPAATGRSPSGHGSAPSTPQSSSSSSPRPFLQQLDDDSPHTPPSRPLQPLSAAVAEAREETLLSSPSASSSPALPAAVRLPVSPTATACEVSPPRHGAARPNPINTALGKGQADGRGAAAPLSTTVSAPHSPSPSPRSAAAASSFRPSPLPALPAAAPAASFAFPPAHGLRPSAGGSAAGTPPLSASASPSARAALSQPSATTPRSGSPSPSSPPAIGRSKRPSESGAGGVVLSSPPMAFTLWTVAATAGGVEEAQASAGWLFLSEGLLCYSTASTAREAAALLSLSMPLSSITQLSVQRELPLVLSSRLSADRLLLVFSSGGGCWTLEGSSVDVRDYTFRTLHHALVQAGRKPQQLTPLTPSTPSTPAPAAPAAQSPSSAAAARLRESGGVRAGPTLASSSSSSPSSSSPSLSPSPAISAFGQPSRAPTVLPAHLRSRSVDVNSVLHSQPLPAAAPTAAASSHSRPPSLIPNSPLSSSPSAALSFFHTAQQVSCFEEAVEGEALSRIHRRPVSLYLHSPLAAKDSSAASAISEAMPNLASLLLCWCSPAALPSSSSSSWSTSSSLSTPPPLPSRSVRLASVVHLSPSRELGLLRSLLIKAPAERCLAVVSPTSGLYLEAASREQRDLLLHALHCLITHAGRRVKEDAAPSWTSPAPPHPPSHDRAQAERNSGGSSFAPPPAPASHMSSPSAAPSSALPPLPPSPSSHRLPLTPSPPRRALLADVDERPASAEAVWPPPLQAPSPSPAAVAAPPSPASSSASPPPSDFDSALALLSEGDHFTLWSSAVGAGELGGGGGGLVGGVDVHQVTSRPVLVYFEPAMGDAAPGSLCLSSSQAGRSAPPDCRLLLNSTKRMALGKDSPVWQSAEAWRVPAACCLSLTAAGGLSLHLEARSGAVRDAWQRSIHRLLVRCGLQAVESQRHSSRRSATDAPHTPSTPHTPRTPATPHTPHTPMAATPTSPLALLASSSPQAPAEDDWPASAPLAADGLQSRERNTTSPTPPPLPPLPLSAEQPLHTTLPSPQLARSVLSSTAVRNTQPAAVDAPPPVPLVPSTALQLRATPSSAPSEPVAFPPPLPLAASSPSSSFSSPSLSAASPPPGLLPHLAHPPPPPPRLSPSPSVRVVPSPSSSAESSASPPLPVALAAPRPLPSSSSSSSSSPSPGVSSPSQQPQLSRTIRFSDPTETFHLQAKVPHAHTTTTLLARTSCSGAAAAERSWCCVVRACVCHQIGEGSYGCVYRAVDVRDERLVAIKVLPFDGRDNSRASLKLRKEIHILQQCQSPYIVGYRGAYQKVPHTAHPPHTHTGRAAQPAQPAQRSTASSADAHPSRAAADVSALPRLCVAARAAMV